MSSSSTVSYTSIYTDFEPWRFQWVFDEEPEAPKEAPPSPDYVFGPEHPSSPNYMPGPEHPPLPDYEDLEEDPEEDHGDYPADRGDNDDDDECSGDDTDDEDKEASDEEDDDEEEEHLASVESSAVPIDDHIPLAEDIKAFETNESATLPPLLRLCRDEICVRLPSPMAASMEARIAEFASAPTPPSSLTPLSSLLAQITSPPLHVPSPLTTGPSYVEAPLGYRAARIRLRATSPSTHHLSEIPSPPLLLTYTTHRDDIPKANIPLQKRVRFTAPAFGFEVGESLAAAAARQLGLEVATVDDTPRCHMSREVGYGIEDVWDDMLRDMEERAPTLEDLS
uniref:Uncharacterized protein n=1 Tax=Tanacetum cinerariifolium TaxID=118510 RepID=A0A699GHJ2_TANCI|nr:hypothetical protein [Tanacetum cinerariifolium]